MTSSPAPPKIVSSPAPPRKQVGPAVAEDQIVAGIAVDRVARRFRIAIVRSVQLVIAVGRPIDSCRRRSRRAGNRAPPSRRAYRHPRRRG